MSFLIIREPSSYFLFYFNFDVCLLVGWKTNYGSTLRASVTLIAGHSRSSNLIFTLSQTSQRWGQKGIHYRQDASYLLYEIKFSGSVDWCMICSWSLIHQLAFIEVHNYRVLVIVLTSTFIIKYSYMYGFAVIAPAIQAFI